MGTNYYRIPSKKELEHRKGMLMEQIKDMRMDPADVERGFRFIEDPNAEYDWDNLRSPWDIFTESTCVHLGKRSGGWTFVWNFHDDVFYHDKQSLLEFIRNGRIVNEYGEVLDPEEFIQMALEWGQPDGFTLEKYYKANPSHRTGFEKPERFVDGLRISDSTDFS